MAAERFSANSVYRLADIPEQRKQDNFGVYSHNAINPID